MAFRHAIPSSFTFVLFIFIFNCVLLEGLFGIAILLQF